MDEMYEMCRSYCDMYYEVFGQSFPLMQSPNMEKAMDHMSDCMEQNKLAEDLYPEIYGALPGLEA